MKYGIDKSFKHTEARGPRTAGNRSKYDRDSDSYIQATKYTLFCSRGFKMAVHRPEMTDRTGTATLLTTRIVSAHYIMQHRRIH